MVTPVDRMLGRYRLVEQIGQGGMATVYKALDRSRQTWVAVKVLTAPIAADAQFIRRFQREAQLLQNLNHPHIVPVLEFGEQDGGFFLAMPFYQDGSLASRLRRGPLTLREGGLFIQEICSALEYAHQHGVIHRDVKPSNILLEGGQAHLADFGLAHVHDASVSLTGSALLGTPAYVAPEQATGAGLDARVDQYSLGVVLFEIATGRLPYEADTPMAALAQMLHEPIPRPRSIKPSVPEVVERLILKATARDPDDRFPTMEALGATWAAALNHLQDPSTHPAPQIDLPPSARLPDAPITMPLPSVRPAPRRKTKALAIAGLALLLLLGCPVMASGTLDLLQTFASPVEGSIPATAPAVELTHAAATIESLSTAVAASLGAGLDESEVILAVAGTLTAIAPAAAVNASPTPEDFLASAETASAVPVLPGLGSTATVSRTPSRTPTRTRTPTAAASGTPAGPSSTPSGPTSTGDPGSTPTDAATLAPSATPTSTPPPPTATATDILDALDCDALYLENPSVTDDTLSVTTVNDGPIDVYITRVAIDWPSQNAELKKIKFIFNTIWDSGDSNPPTNVTSGWDGGPGNRRLDSGESHYLRFEFDVPAEPTGYSISVTFDGICQADASH